MFVLPVYDLCSACCKQFSVASLASCKAEKASHGHSPRSQCLQGISEPRNTFDHHLALRLLSIFDNEVCRSRRYAQDRGARCQEAGDESRDILGRVLAPKGTASDDASNASCRHNSRTGERSPPLSHYVICLDRGQLVVRIWCHNSGRGFTPFLLLTWYVILAGMLLLLPPVIRKAPKYRTYGWLAKPSTATPMI